MNFVRGSVIMISGTFTPKAGQTGTPSSSSVRLVYTNVSGATATEDLTMALGTDGVTWAASWDSNHCKSGDVQWWARSAGGLVAATQGSFCILANDANHA